MATNLEPTGTVGFTPASPQNPDILTVNSKDKNAAAANVTVTTLKPVGTLVLVQIRSQQQSAPFQYWHTICAGETVQSIAQSFAGQIAADASACALGIGGQLIVGSAQFCVSHWFNDNITVSAAAWDANGTQIGLDNGGIFTITQGNGNLDAGPIVGINRFPAGWTPTPGSNVGQVNFGGPRTDTVGKVGGTYAGITGNIKNPDPAHFSGELEVDTAEVVNGTPSIRKRLGVTKGLYMSAGGNDLQDMGEGTINCTGLYVNGVRVA